MNATTLTDDIEVLEFLSVRKKAHPVDSVAGYGWMMGHGQDHAGGMLSIREERVPRWGEVEKKLSFSTI